MQAFAEKSRKREEIKEEGGREGRERKNRVKEARVGEEGKEGGREKRNRDGCGTAAATVPPPPTPRAYRVF